MRIGNPAGACIAGAEITGRVVLREGFERGLFDLAQPGTPGTVWGYEHPVKGEWVETAVRGINH